MIISVTNITRRLKAFQESKEWGETLWKKCASTRFPSIWNIDSKYK